MRLNRTRGPSCSTRTCDVFTSGPTIGYPCLPSSPNASATLSSGLVIQRHNFLLLSAKSRNELNPSLGFQRPTRPVLTRYSYRGLGPDTSMPRLSGPPVAVVSSIAEKKASCGLVGDCGG